MAMMRSGNPTLNSNTFTGLPRAGTEPMTLQGTVNKTGILLLMRLSHGGMDMESRQRRRIGRAVGSHRRPGRLRHRHDHHLQKELGAGNSAGLCAARRVSHRRTLRDARAAVSRHRDAGSRAHVRNLFCLLLAYSSG